MNAQVAFDIISLELTIYATLLGFISVMFIFWYGKTHEKYSDKKAKTLGEKIRKLFFHLAFYVYGVFVIFGSISIVSGIWILSLLATYVEPLSDVYLVPGVYNQLLNFSSMFSLWIYFSMFYIVVFLLITIWPKADLSGLFRKKTKTSKNKKEKKR